MDKILIMNADGFKIANSIKTTSEEGGIVYDAELSLTNKAIIVDRVSFQAHTIDLETKEVNNSVKVLESTEGFKTLPGESQVYNFESIEMNRVDNRTPIVSGKNIDIEFIVKNEDDLNYILKNVVNDVLNRADIDKPKDNKVPYFIISEYNKKGNILSNNLSARYLSTLRDFRIDRNSRKGIVLLLVFETYGGPYSVDLYESSISLNDDHFIDYRGMKKNTPEYFYTHDTKVQNQIVKLSYDDLDLGDHLPDMNISLLEYNHFSPESLLFDSYRIITNINSKNLKHLNGKADNFPRDVKLSQGYDSDITIKWNMEQSLITVGSVTAVDISDELSGIFKLPKTSIRTGATAGSNNLEERHTRVLNDASIALKRPEGDNFSKNSMNKRLSGKNDVVVIDISAYSNPGSILKADVIISDKAGKEVKKEVKELGKTPKGSGEYRGLVERAIIIEGIKADHQNIKIKIYKEEGSGIDVRSIYISEYKRVNMDEAFEDLRKRDNLFVRGLRGFMEDFKNSYNSKYYNNIRIKGLNKKPGNKEKLVILKNKRESSSFSGGM